jgi:hypothetical protein
LWGYPALYKKPNKKKKDNEMKPVELFKLHLGNCLEQFKPKLPVDFKKAIVDYLREMGKVKNLLNFQILNALIFIFNLSQILLLSVLKKQFLNIGLESTS